MSVVHFGAPLGALLGTYGLARRSLGARWDSLGSFESDVVLRSETSKVWVLDQLGTARAPLCSFLDVFCASEASSWVLWGTPGAFRVSRGALWVYPRCISCAFGQLWMSVLFLYSLGWAAMGNPYTPAHVSQGFAKSKKTHF